MEVRDILKNLPKTSGVYIMKGSAGEILYVGKAKNLYNRVHQYFLASVTSIKTQTLVSKIADIKYIVTPSEIDALVLENNLIKQHKPPYNILLKDDKTYPYIKIKYRDKYPTVEVTRVLKNDGSRYFGPYMLGISAAAILNLLHYAFPLRSCKNLREKGGVCLNYHLGRCLAPCANKCTPEEYAKVVGDVVAFLQGEDGEVARDLTAKMHAAAEKQDFELAKEYRDNLKILDSIVRKQVAALPKDSNIDVFGVTGDALGAVVCVLNIRGGKTLGMDCFDLITTDGSSDALSQFVMQYYTANPLIATEIVLSEEVDFSSALEEYLRGIAGKKVLVITPKQGVRKQLVDVAIANATEYMDKHYVELKRHQDMTLGAVADLERVLELSRAPYRMECFDISHVSGTNKVASMVVFQSGHKAADMYRRFSIKTVDGNNDYACMREVLTRRIARLADADVSFGERPDLIVIDGGKGQLSSVADVVPEDIDLIALAEREEEIFVRGRGAEPVVLPKSSYALKLLQRLRDEAHRFAVTYHRNLRKKSQTKSALTDIDGIGETRARKLIITFKSIENVAIATITELIDRGGLPKNIAEKVWEYFHCESEE